MAKISHFLIFYFCEGINTGSRDWHTKKNGNTTQKSGNTTQKKITIFLSFLQKLREWHTKTKNYLSQNFMQTHKKTHKNFLILKILQFYRQQVQQHQLVQHPIEVRLQNSSSYLIQEILLASLQVEIFLLLSTFSFT